MIEFNSKYFSFLSQGSELIQHMHDQTKTLPSFSGFNEDLLRYQKEVQKMQYSIVSLNNVQQQYMKYGQIGYSASVAWLMVIPMIFLTYAYAKFVFRKN